MILKAWRTTLRDNPEGQSRGDEGDEGDQLEEEGRPESDKGPSWRWWSERQPEGDKCDEVRGSPQAMKVMKNKAARSQPKAMKVMSLYDTCTFLARFLYSRRTIIELDQVVVAHTDFW